MTTTFNPTNPTNPDTIHSITNESYVDYCCNNKVIANDYGWDIWAYLMPQLNNWIETANQHARNEDYYRNVCIEIGKSLGPEIYTGDDGSVADEVLIDKLIEVAQSKLQSEYQPQPDYADALSIEIHDYGQRLINLGKAFQSPTTTILDLKRQARNLGFDIDMKITEAEW